MWSTQHSCIQLLVLLPLFFTTFDQFTFWDPSWSSPLESIYCTPDIRHRLTLQQSTNQYHLLTHVPGRCHPLSLINFCLCLGFSLHSTYTLPFLVLIWQCLHRLFKTPFIFMPRVCVNKGAGGAISRAWFDDTFLHTVCSWHLSVEVL